MVCADVIYGIDVHTDIICFIGTLFEDFAGKSVVLDVYRDNMCRNLGDQSFKYVFLSE